MPKNSEGENLCPTKTWYARTVTKSSFSQRASRRFTRKKVSIMNLSVARNAAGRKNNNAAVETAAADAVAAALAAAVAEEEAGNTVSKAMPEALY